MEMVYNGTLVMPNNFVAVTEEEMTYVEGGGYYMDYDSCCAFAWALGVTLSSSSAVIYSALLAGGGTVAGALQSIPVVGQLVGLIGAAYFIAQGKEFAESLCGAISQGKGVDIGLG